MTDITLTRPAEGVVLATLDRPDRLNAITAQMFDDFETLGRDLARNAERVRDARVLIITGAGRGCSGYDLDLAGDLTSLSATQMLDLQERAADALKAIHDIRIPVIAAVNGAAAGGGLSLALAADIRLASEHASFVASFSKIGLSAGDLGASWLLPRVVGPAHAADIAFTGRTVRAEEALRMRLVNRVVPAESLLDEAVALATSIAQNSPWGVRISKRALQANLEVPSYAAALELENRGQTLLTRTSDMAEALAAFLGEAPGEVHELVSEAMRDTASDTASDRADNRAQEPGALTRIGDLTLEHLTGDSAGITILTIDRPARMNSVTTRVFADLGEAARTVRRDGTRVLIITGAGDRAFSAGYDLADISGLLDTTVQEFLDIEETASGAVGALHALPFPVIAAVNGAAAGGGLSLALATDLRVVAERASFSAAFVRVGFSVGELGTSFLLPRLVGPGLAAELAFTARLVSPREALAIGLADRVVEGGSLRDEAIALARTMLAPAPSTEAGTEATPEAETDAEAATAAAASTIGSSTIASTTRIGKRTLQAAAESASLDVSLRARLTDRP